MNAAADGPSVAVVGGGLAGLAASVTLATAGCRVELFEARRMLGGRASSFRDPASGDLVDHCQHVGMGCCTNLADFCRRTGIDDFFRRDDALWFIGPTGKRHSVRASRWLPAPLHLAPSFLRLSFLPLGDRIKIGRAMWKLARLSPGSLPKITIGQWLVDDRQSPVAIDRFWKVILTSALSEGLERISLAAARKVLVEGFMATRGGYALEIPEIPLGTLYGECLQTWFAEHEVKLHLGTAVRQVSCAEQPEIALAVGAAVRPDFVVLAVPWSRVAALVSPALALRWPWLDAVSRFEAAPITGVHLWFDRPITALAHAVLVGRLSQWMFNRGPQSAVDGGTAYYYQVVISASRDLAGRDRDEVIAQVCGELAAVWPQVVAARLLEARLVTDHSAVFSPQPGLDDARPSQRTAAERVMVAGDWTATGWPATMESAVRSGYLAAEGVLAACGRPQTFLAADLPRGWLARRLIVER